MPCIVVDLAPLGYHGVSDLLDARAVNPDRADSFHFRMVHAPLVGVIDEATAKVVLITTGFDADPVDRGTAGGNSGVIRRPASKDCWRFVFMNGVPLCLLPVTLSL